MLLGAAEGGMQERKTDRSISTFRKGHLGNWRGENNQGEKG